MPLGLINFIVHLNTRVQIEGGSNQDFKSIESINLGG